MQPKLRSYQAAHSCVQPKNTLIKESLQLQPHNKRTEENQLLKKTELKLCSMLQDFKWNQRNDQKKTYFGIAVIASHYYSWDLFSKNQNLYKQWNTKIIIKIKELWLAGPNMLHIFNPLFHSEWTTNQLLF